MARRRGRAARPVDRRSSTGRSSAGWRSRRSPPRSVRRSSRSFVRALRSTRVAASRVRPRNGGSARGARSLVLLRPEAGVLVGVFAVIAARGSRASLGVRRARAPELASRRSWRRRSSSARTASRPARRSRRVRSSSCSRRIRTSPTSTARARTWRTSSTFAIKGVRAELSAVRALGLVAPGARARVARIARATAGRAAHACSARSRGCCSSRSTTTRRSTTSATTRRRCSSCSSPRRSARGDRARARARAGRSPRRASSPRRSSRAAPRIPAQVEALHARRGRTSAINRSRSRCGSQRASEPGASVLLGDAGAIPFVSETRRARCARPRRLPADAVRARGGARRGSDGRAHRAPRASERPTLPRALPELVRRASRRGFGVEIERVTLERQPHLRRARRR